MTRAIGSVRELAEAWSLDSKLSVTARLGEAYQACLDSSVEASGRAKTQAGIAYTDDRRIVLNTQLLHPGREHDRDATFLHECAHIIANIHHRRNCRHDVRWRRVMHMLGEPPEVSHEIDYLSRETHAIVTWICNHCGDAYHFVRRPRRRITECYCRSCGPRRGRLSVFKKSRA